MMVAARPPKVRSQPSTRIRDAVTGEYKPPGSEAAFSTPLSLSKKISHRIVYGHAISRPARRRTDVGLFAQIVALPSEAWAAGATPGTDTGPLKIEASLADTEVHTGPLPHDAWRTSRLSSSMAMRSIVMQPAVVATGSSGFLCGRSSRTTGPPYRFSMLSKNDNFSPRSAQPPRDNPRRPSHARNALTEPSAAATGMMTRRADFHRARREVSAMPPTSWTLTATISEIDQSYESNNTRVRAVKCCQYLRLMVRRRLQRWRTEQLIGALRNLRVYQASRNSYSAVGVTPRRVLSRSAIVLRVGSGTWLRLVLARFGCWPASPIRSPSAESAGRSAACTSTAAMCRGAGTTGLKRSCHHRDWEQMNVTGHRANGWSAASGHPAPRRCGGLQRCRDVGLGLRVLA